MTCHQSLGHIGGNMDGINTYDVCIVFNIKASNDDEALSQVSRTLANGDHYEWTWIYTTLNKRESND
jgi:hypothetical protein